MTEKAPPYGADQAATDSPYHSRSQQTLLRLLDVLALDPLGTAPLPTLVAACNAPRDHVFRALKNLELAGWVAQTPSGGWRLTPRLTLISERLRIAIADLHHTYLQPGGRHD